MHKYRIYILNLQDRIAEILEDSFTSERHALERADHLRGGHYAAEVWTGERLVARLGGVLQLG
jgi:hypothetical protein